MKFNNVLLHGINDIEQIDKRFVFHRLPKKVRSNLESPGTVSSANNGTEIRFHITGIVKVVLSTVAEVAKVIIYYGDYQHDLKIIRQDEAITIILDQMYLKEQLDKIVKYRHRFDPHLVRLVLFEEISLDLIEGSYHYPKESEMPKKRYLSYGTSITQGRRALTPDLTYPSILGELIKHDVYNYGMSGCCFIEDEMVNFLGQESYDFITLCLSVNMLGRGYSLEVFEKRTRNLLNVLTTKNPNSPIFLISILTNWRDVGLTKPLTSVSTVAKYRSSLEVIAKEYKNIAFIDGFETLTVNHLCSDILHPGNLGLIEIAYKLFDKFKELDLK